VNLLDVGLGWNGVQLAVLLQPFDSPHRHAVHQGKLHVQDSIRSRLMRWRESEL
jgi:hypothetical protein